MANSRRNAIMRQNRPMASDRANPRMAYEKSCCLRLGFLAYPMMRDPKTDPIPAPDPATPTVAAPAPMNLAAESMSPLVELAKWEAMKPVEEMNREELLDAGLVGTVITGVVDPKVPTFWPHDETWDAYVARLQAAEDEE